MVFSSSSFRAAANRRTLTRDSARSSPSRTSDSMASATWESTELRSVPNRGCRSFMDRNVGHKSAVPP